MLENMRNVAMAEIEKRYGIKSHFVRAYLHYLPTFWHLHVHFDHTAKGGPTHNCGKCVFLDDVIDNLRREPSFYETANLTFTAGGTKDAKILSAIGMGED